MLIAKQLDHVALQVADLDASVAFYRDVLCLPPMERPAFDFPGAWFRIGTTQELHLIAGRQAPVDSDRRGGHFAIRIESPDAWEAHLDQNNAVRLPRKPRPDGASQTFVRDPDGHWIELSCLEGVVDNASQD
jgi:catechol 2,3-dioxygenase-like lactoylglutathione lyase family enzyme